MKLIAIALIVTSALCAAGATQRAAGAASIEGVVVKTGAADVRLQLPASPGQTSVAAGIGDPLSGATVELTVVDGDRIRSYTTRTGRDGKFQFRNLPPGFGYQLVAILAPDYLPGQYGQTAPGVAGEPITLSSGQELKDIRIPLTPAGSISGRVISPGGARIESWRMAVVRPFYVDGQRVLGALPSGKTGVVSTTSTNRRGEYEFTGLPPGDYYVMDAVGNFYTGRTHSPAALHLRPGENLKNVDFDITLSASRTVGGQILDLDRVPVKSAEVAFIRRDEAASIASPRFRRTGPTFMLPTAATGAYLALAKGIVKGLPVFGYRPVDVGAADISNLQIVVAPPSDISGLVVGSPPGGRVEIRLRPLLPGMGNASITGVSPGFIAVGVGAGEYRVEAIVSPAGDAYIQSIRFDSRESTDGIIRLNGQTNPHLEIRIGLAGGVVSGRVQDDRRQPVRNVRAVLVPERPRRGRHDLYRTMLTSEQGEFEMHGVAPGAYSLFVWEVAQEGAWFDPNFLSFYENLGKAVLVQERGRITVQASPISQWH